MKVQPSPRSCRRAAALTIVLCRADPMPFSKQPKLGCSLVQSGAAILQHLPRLGASTGVLKTAK